MTISDALATQLLNAAPDPTVMVDSDGIIIYANARVLEVLGYAPEEIIGEPVEVLLPKRVRAGHPRQRNGFFANPTARAMGSALELHALRKDGVEIPVEISLNLLETPEGKVVSSAIRDMSEQKAIAQELKEANRAKSRFLAAASHDLRQPIQTLNLLNRAAKRITQDKKHLEIIDKQQKGLDWMGNLLNSLLDISKLEAGVIEPNIEDCSVSAIFDTLQATFEEQAIEKGLRFRVDEDNHTVRTDSKLLTQILENFISNAIRYTQTGMVRLHGLVNGTNMRLAVSDTGIGIAAAELESIFEEFHQAEQSSRTEGLGLGLSIVQRTADLLKCQVGVESEPGEGSSFYVDVPISERGVQNPEETGETEPMVPGGGHVLIVDDEPDIIDATRLLLELEGFIVTSAQSIATLRGALMGCDLAPDLLISDFHLRDGETGLQVIDLVRDTFKKDIPVILVSGDTANQKLLSDQPQVTFLTKPVDVEQLLEKAIQLASEGQTE